MDYPAVIAKNDEVYLVQTAEHMGHMCFPLNEIKMPEQPIASIVNHRPGWIDVGPYGPEHSLTKMCVGLKEVD